MLAQGIDQIFRQGKAQDLFYIADQQGDALFNLVAIARRTRAAVAAVEAIFENGAELVFENGQRLCGRNVTVAQIDVFAGQEAIEQIALFDAAIAARRAFKLRQRAGVNTEQGFTIEQRVDQYPLLLVGLVEPSASLPSSSRTSCCAAIPDAQAWAHKNWISL